MICAAWFEWFPDGAQDISGLTISPGDTIYTAVQATSPNSGYTWLINYSTGLGVEVEISNPASLCMQDAEWIVEDFEENGGMVPFANFGSVTFSGAVATTNSGGNVSPQGATIIDIYQNQVLTSTSVDSTSVTVRYV